MGQLDFLSYFFILSFGFAVGSFLNSVIYRLENGVGFAGRSFCLSCRYKLKWIDLIPVFSFLFLRGRCRHCGQKISLQYPLVEISTALIFLITFSTRPSPSHWSDFIYLCFIFYVSCSMIVIFIYDLKNYLIPDVVLLPTIAITFLYRLLESFVLGAFSQFSNHFFSALLASLFFFILWVISQGYWLGFGDVKLAILLGLFLGFPNILVGLFLAFLFGAIIGIGLMIFGKKNLTSQVPFAPFLIVGTLTTFLWGDRIVNWYLKILYG